MWTTDRVFWDRIVFLPLRRIALISFLLVTISASYAAEDQLFVNGNILYELCQKPGDVGTVRGYVTGVIDYNATLRSVEERISPLCVPNNVTGSQVSNIVCQYVRNNPKIRLYSA